MQNIIKQILSIAVFKPETSNKN